MIIHAASEINRFRLHSQSASQSKIRGANATRPLPIGALIWHITVNSCDDSRLDDLFSREASRFRVRPSYFCYVLHDATRRFLLVLFACVFYTVHMARFTGTAQHCTTIHIGTTGTGWSFCQIIFATNFVYHKIRY